MRLQKHKGRVYKGKQYPKWVIVIPKNDVEALGWQEGDDLEGTVIKGKGYFLSVKE